VKGEGRAASAATPRPSVPPVTEHIVTRLFERGWSVCDGFLSDALVTALAGEARAAWSGGSFHAAGIGSGPRYQRREEVRGDYVLWLDRGGCTSKQRECLARFEDLRQAANRELQLGLFELECHFALYPPGASYRRHLDQLAGDDSRVLSCVLYLNDGWQRADGGELRLHQAQPDGHVDVLPVGGRLVTFLSARFEHEVLPARRERLSLTGWFCRRS
jgi:SM-20-related protein